MADRNYDANRDRRPRWANQPGEHDSHYGQQHEQFEAGGNSQNYGSSQMGDPSWRTDATSYYGNDRNGQGAMDRSIERYRTQGMYRQGNSQNRMQDQARQSGDFDAMGYRSQGRSYGGYTGDSYGSASSAWSARGNQDPSGLYSTDQSSTWRSDHDRGFLQRAGDEVASWFGDEEAARRREADHSGRGPTNYTRSDQRILEDVCDRITDDWRVDGTGVQVTVDNGEVTLDGTVPSRDQKRRAEDCADAISGVKHVQNNLRVDTASGASATDDASSKPAPFI